MYIKDMDATPTCIILNKNYFNLLKKRSNFNLMSLESCMQIR